MSEKTHDATDKRLQEMRKQGQVARSQDVGRMLVLAVVAETLLGLRADMFELMQTMLQFSLTRIGRDFSLVGIEALWYVSRQIFINGLLIVLIAAVVRLVADSLQFGWIFAPKALKLNFDKLDPTKKIKQMFGKSQIWELLGMIIKLGILIGVGLMALQTMIVPITKLVYGTFLDPIWEMLARVLIWQVRVSSMALIAMAGADVLMQKKMHRENSRMDLQELKQEMREGDGDPEAKMARRHMGQEWLEEEPRPRPPAETQEVLGHTDLLVTNPTHIVALAIQLRIKRYCQWRNITVRYCTAGRITPRHLENRAVKAYHYFSGNFPKQIILIQIDITRRLDFRYVVAHHSGEVL